MRLVVLAASVLVAASIRIDTIPMIENADGTSRPAASNLREMIREAPLESMEESAEAKANTNAWAHAGEINRKSHR